MASMNRRYCTLEAVRKIAEGAAAKFLIRKISLVFLRGVVFVQFAVR